jgi:hypothetical protein
MKGFHLWRIVLSSYDPNLWITTKFRSIPEATRKARIVIRRDGFNSQINSVVWEGTIDL